MAEIPKTSARQRWTLALVCTAAFMLLLDITVVSIAGSRRGPARRPRRGHPRRPRRHDQRAQ